MSHLIKLEDYISRYQFDIYRYPNQFTRLKKERWQNVKHEWENRQVVEARSRFSFNIDDSYDVVQKEEGFLSKTFNKIKKITLFQSQKTDTELGALHSNVDPVMKARSLEELKRLFLEDLYYSQLRWASSSLLEQSHLNPRYRYDKQLRFFVQQIPDNYLLMYRPIFYIKKARVDMGVILISPTEIYCITLLDGSENSIFDEVQERFWVERVDQQQKKFISPMIELNRMASIVSDIVKENELKVPIKKIILSPGSYIDNQMQGMKTEFVDKRNFTTWQEKIKKHPSPLKSGQLKVGKVLLEQCHTSAYKRQEIVENEQEEEIDEYDK